MADSLDSSSIARKAFDVGRRGYEQQEVRAFLHEVSALIERLQREEVTLRERAERAEARLGLSERPDEAMLLEMLGEETTRVLSSARDAAAEIRTKAETAAERIIGDAASEAADTRSDAVREADRRLAEATTESESIVSLARSEHDRRKAEAEEAATRIREESAAQAQSALDEAKRDLDRAQEEAAAAVEAGRIRGREMVAEAQVVRERVLRDLAARRKKARQQVEKLNAGRERLLEAYDVVRRTIDEASTELTVSLSDARLAADAAARRIADEPEPTLEQLDQEVTDARIAGLPIADLGGSDLGDDIEEEPEDPGPFSGEVPAVVVDTDAVVLTTDVEQVAADAPAEPDARRGRKGRRRKGASFEGLPAGKLIRVEPPVEGEGIRILEDPDPVDPVDASVPEAEAADGSSPLGGDEGDTSSSPASDVFARLRAEQEPEPEPDPVAEGEAAVDEAPADEADAEPDSEVAEDAGDLEVAADEEVEPEPVDDPGAAPFRARDAALASIDKELSRRLKRALADEQNEVLDLLRRAKPKGVDDLLPVADDHAARWADTAATALAEAAAAGAEGATPTSTVDLADELARHLTAPLRDRIDRSFAASDGNLDDVADRVRALYREWKGQRLSETSRHFLAAAYARGAFDAVPSSGQVQWILDPSVAPCPDCDDNVLAGAVPKGDEFPTGHACAPAHPGCRCLVRAADD